MPYVGEIRLFAGTFEPNGWKFCEGQLLSITENETLFTIIGTTYGGDGEETFALPDLRGRLPMHRSNDGAYAVGQSGGVEEVTLTTQQLPIHTHAALASLNTAGTTSPLSNVPAAIPDAVVTAYGTDAPITALSASSLTPVGGSQPHTNLQPYLCIHFIMSLYGIFPQQT